MFVNEEAQTTIHAQNQAVDRALALYFIGLNSEGVTTEQLSAIDKAYHLSSKLTPTERAYITAQHPIEQQRTDANWHYEGLHVLLWTLSYVPTLAYPDQRCGLLIPHDVPAIGLAGT